METHEVDLIELPASPGMCRAKKGGGYLRCSLLDTCRAQKIRADPDSRRCGLRDVIFANRQEYATWKLTK